MCYYVFCEASGTMIDSAQVGKATDDRAVGLLFVAPQCCALKLDVRDAAIDFEVVFR